MESLDLKFFYLIKQLAGRFYLLDFLIVDALQTYGVSTASALTSNSASF